MKHLSPPNAVAYSVQHRSLLGYIKLRGLSNKGFHKWEWGSNIPISTNSQLKLSSSFNGKYRQQATLTLKGPKLEGPQIQLSLAMSPNKQQLLDVVTSCWCIPLMMKKSKESAELKSTNPCLQDSNKSYRATPSLKAAEGLGHRARLLWSKSEKQAERLCLEAAVKAGRPTEEGSVDASFQTCRTGGWRQASARCLTCLPIHKDRICSGCSMADPMAPEPLAKGNAGTVWRN